VNLKDKGSKKERGGYGGSFGGGLWHGKYVLSALAASGRVKEKAEEKQEKS